MAKKTTPTKKSATKANEVKTSTKKVATPKEKAPPVSAEKDTVKKDTAITSNKKAAVAKKVVAEEKATKVPTTKKVAAVKPVVKKEKVEAKKPTTKEKAIPKGEAKVKNEKMVAKEKAAPKGEMKASKEKVDTKEKSIPKVEGKVKKEKVEVKEKVAKTTATKEKKEKKEKPPKVVSKRKKAVFVPAPPMGKSEIVDAVRLKPRKNVNKPGHVIAIRSKVKEEVKEDVSVTMEKYNPEQRSVLDDVNESTGPIYRYSDEELTEFRELITNRLEKARKELNYLQGLITRKDEEGTEDTDNRFNHMEDGSGAMEREQLSQLAGRQVQFISHLENAMVRIENKTYGVCRVTGHLIDKARLRAVPHATLSIEAKNDLRRGR